MNEYVWRAIESSESLRKILCTIIDKDVVIPSELEPLIGYSRSYIKERLRRLRDLGIVKDIGLHPKTYETMYVLVDEVKSIRDELKRRYCGEESRKPLEHKTLVDMIVDLGRRLGYIVEVEKPDPHNLYRYDVVWFRPPRTTPVKIFEIVVGGDVDRALARLKHAIDIWASDIGLYLVVADESQYRRAEALVGKLLEGTFHELKGKVNIIPASMIESLLRDHELVEFIKSLIT